MINYKKDFTYANPWNNNLCLDGAKYHIKSDTRRTISKCGKGCIVHRLKTCNDYIVDGKVVAQRMGYSVELLNIIIQYIHKGTLPAKNSKFYEHIKLYGENLLEAYNSVGKVS